MCFGATKCIFVAICNFMMTVSNVLSVFSGNLDEVIGELNELRLLIQNSMPYPLYGDICKLLGILYLVKVS